MRTRGRKQDYQALIDGNVLTIDTSYRDCVEIIWTLAHPGCEDLTQLPLEAVERLMEQLSGWLAEQG